MTEVNSKISSLEYITQSADYIKSKITFTPRLLIVCGTGLGGLADTLHQPTSINYEDIPNFPVSTVEGHAGKLVFGTLSNVKVVCMKGRFHYYEGYSVRQITMPIRVMKLLGVKGMIITNAAGGVNQSYKPGDIMVLQDHFNFLGFGGQNPLRGPNEPFFGPRFFPTNKAYDRSLIDVARQASKEIGLDQNYHEGVYGINAGPNYESIAEIRGLLTLGVDAIGMSTVPEVLVAIHSGLSVFGFSLITNSCIMSYDDSEEPNHEEVLQVVESRSEQLKEFVTKIVAKSQERWC